MEYIEYLKSAENKQKEEQTFYKHVDKIEKNKMITLCFSNSAHPFQELFSQLEWNNFYWMKMSIPIEI